MLRAVLSGYYFFLFFAVGVLSPLLALYLDTIGLDGDQIGMAMAIGPLVLLVAQPLWGLLADRYHRSRLILLLASAMTALVAVGFLFLEGFLWIAVIVGLMSFFQASLVPLADNLTMQVAERRRWHYGSVRLWGAVGFALSIGLGGWLTELTTDKVIFFLFIGAMLLTALCSLGMPRDSSRRRTRIGKGLLALLKKPAFLTFLLVNMLVFGSMNAHNIYFGLYYKEMGGTVAGVGLAFLLFTLSEIPFFLAADWCIRRFRVEPVLMFAVAISVMRWLLYAAAPHRYWVLSLFVLQGISVGLYLPGALKWVKSLAPKEVQTTAVALSAMVGNGIGTTALNFLGGWVMERFSIFATYGALAAACGMATVVLWFLTRFRSRG